MLEFLLETPYHFESYKKITGASEKEASEKEASEKEASEKGLFVKKVSLFYRLRALSLSALILFTSCATNLPQPPKSENPNIDTPQPIVTADDPTAIKGWFWNPSWWEQDGALVPEVVGTINENPWILQTAGRARNAALRTTATTPQFNLAKAKQKWNAATGLLTVLVPFQDVASPYFATVFIRPQWNAWGPHTWTIEGVDVTGILKVSGNSNIAVMTVQINSDSTFGTGFMQVIDPVAKKTVSSFETEGNALETQIASLASPTVTALGVEPCAPSGVTVAKVGSTVPTPVPPCKDSTVNPPKNTGSNTIDSNNTISETRPLPFPPVDASQPDCAALLQAWKDADETRKNADENSRSYWAASGAFCTGAAVQVGLDPLTDVACGIAVWQAKVATAQMNQARKAEARAAAAYKNANCKK